MIIKVEEFCRVVSSDLNNFIDKLVLLTNRNTNSERIAWTRSLTQLSVILSNEKLKNYYLYFDSKGQMEVEYRLPSSSSWCDAILLGSTGNKPSVIILELKDWELNNDKEGKNEGLIEHNGKMLLHPSEQVRGYVEYCQRFHSTVLEKNASVHGCVYFTNSTDATAYSNGIYTELTKKYPIFTISDEDGDNNFPNFLPERIKLPDEDFAKAFDNGYYKQDRNLIIQVAKNFQDNSSTPFVLLDEQRKGFEIAFAKVKQAINNYDKKQVIIIEGPPGSGKSALAANIWAEAVKYLEGKETVVFTTTSFSQRKNWERLFRVAGRNRIAGGIVKTSNSYNPGLSTKWVNKKRDEGIRIEIEDWKNNIKIFLSENRIKCKDDLYFISIVDEAHALIDPTKRNARGIAAAGWTLHAGPQGWHIIRSSKITIFLLDSHQSFRDNETTTIKDIYLYADELKADIEHINLSGAQFRCGGSIEYLNWIDKIFEIGEAQKEDLNTNFNEKFLFKVVDYPDELETKLKKEISNGKTARLAATYAREWKTQKVIKPHEIKDAEKDFYFTYKKNGKTIKWSKIWNFAPNADYTLFIQAPPGSMMYEDPLSEIGCPYVIRGFDYDYIGLLWLSDLVWKNNNWIVNTEHSFDSAFKNTRSKARKNGQNSSDYQNLLNKIKKSYRILLTRPLKGIYIWFEDEETKKHVLELLSDYGS